MEKDEIIENEIINGIQFIQLSNNQNEEENTENNLSIDQENYLKAKNKIYEKSKKIKIDQK